MNKDIEKIAGNFNDKYTEFIIPTKNTELPQQYILSNPTFGTLVSNKGIEYTFHINSKLNKLTELYNDTYVSERGEEFEGLFGKDYTTTYGFGYAIYLQDDARLMRELTVFVPSHDNIKVQRVKLTNKTDKPIKHKIKYKVRPVLGESREFTFRGLVSKAEKQNNINVLLIRNIANTDIKDECMYIFSNHENYTINELENSIEFEMEIPSNTVYTFDIMLGASQFEEERVKNVLKYINKDKVGKELESTKKYWNDLVLPKEKIDTGNKGVDIMMNGWLVYQTINCRLYARCSKYQCGGAYGFRDQLQDAIGIADILPELSKQQIVKHASKQFEEGDVIHWWHEPMQNGIRARYSDDPLWLAYAISEYIEVTNDKSILDIQVPYLDDENKEVFDVYYPKSYAESIYEHGKRGIDYILSHKEKNGLLEIQGGDWNDGMSNIKGASMFTSIFAIYILDRWIEICRSKRDFEKTAVYQKERYNLEKLVMNLGYNGEYFSRILVENGKDIGTPESTECKIDLIPQVWFTITFAEDATKRDIIYKVLREVEDNLVDRENKIIKLFTPAFDKEEQDIGYIKKYIPGIRENGGQYTHAAIWLAKAYNDIGEIDKAKEIIDYLLPINRIQTIEELYRYKGEIYAIPADIYSNEEHPGRAGWTYYTGSSTWLYKVIKEVYRL